MPRLGLRPEPRTIRSEHLVDQDQLPSVRLPKLKFRVRQHNPSPSRVFGSTAVDLEAPRTQRVGDLTNRFPHHLKRDIFVVPAGGLGGRSENRLRQAVSRLQASRQGNPAHGACVAVFLEAAARQPATHNTLKRHHPGLTDKHRPPHQRCPIDLGWQPHRLHIGGDQVMVDTKPGKPKGGDCRQHAAFVWNRRGQNPVKSADAIGAHDQHAIAEVVTVADLSAMHGAKPEVSVEERHAGVLAEGVSKNPVIAGAGQRTSHPRLPGVWPAHAPPIPAAGCGPPPESPHHAWHAHLPPARPVV